ncbi:unnamed protein product [Lactuca virosa]|uniref:Uncharacterized protein n=1 Tax=Lactuca virosa TaxID=75947 RepID=A0AAU9P6E1_9ASTR|nr:unnamed protein product [Lactuca virosa]
MHTTFFSFLHRHIDVVVTSVATCLRQSQPLPITTSDLHIKVDLRKGKAEAKGVKEELHYKTKQLKRFKKKRKLS